MNKAVMIVLNLTLIACNIALLRARRNVGDRNIAANIASTVAIVAGVIAIIANLPT